MGEKIQNRRKSSKRPKTNASVNACKIDLEYDTITQVASVYVMISVIIVAMRNKTTLISNPVAVTA